MTTKPHFIDPRYVHAALATLEAAWQEYAKAQTDGTSEVRQKMLRDSVIQRFEYTVEQTWKFLQRVLEQDPDTRIVEEARKGSRSTLRLAAEKGWLEDQAQWRVFIDTRNARAHQYDEQGAIASLAQVPALIEATRFTLTHFPA